MPSWVPSTSNMLPVDLARRDKCSNPTAFQSLYCIEHLFSQTKEVRHVGSSMRWFPRKTSGLSLRDSHWHFLPQTQDPSRQPNTKDACDRKRRSCRHADKGEDPIRSRTIRRALPDSHFLSSPLHRLIGVPTYHSGGKSIRCTG